MIEHRLLVCTDTHARMKLPEVTDPRALAWLHGGDFYQGTALLAHKRMLGGEGLKGHRGRKAAMEQWRAACDIPVYTVRGNHDVTDPWGFFAGTVDLAGRLEEIAPNLFLGGIGWHGESFFDLPDDGQLDPICAPLERQIEARIGPDDCLIILSHYPAVTELCPGFDRLQRFMETCRPRVFLQGHIHEAFEQSCTLPWEDGRQTLVLNPGPWGGVLSIGPNANEVCFHAARHRAAE